MAIRIMVMLVFVSFFLVQKILAQNSFHNYYNYLWGSNHFSVNPQGTEVQLLMDKSYGIYLSPPLSLSHSLVKS